MTDCTTEYETCIVGEGDTLYGISKRFRISTNWLKKLNGLADDILHTNQILRIRSSEKSPSLVVNHGNSSQNQIALTYDCGGNDASLIPDILKVLKQNKVKATFFLTGEWSGKFPEEANAIVNAGYEIGNHSYSHTDFTKLNIEEINQEITRAEESIRHITGIETRPLFRYPYGAFNNPVLTTAGLAGYSHSIQWSLDTLDWKQPPSETIIELVCTQAKAGDIILMHAHGRNTARASGIFIPELLTKGFHLDFVSELI